MLFQFEHERFNVCGDCPCWCPRYIQSGWASNEGVCSLDFEERNRFDDKPSECPMEVVEEDEKQ